MRDLKDYEKSYALLPFENIQARYRKRKILETVQKYRPRSILEIGCGQDSFFNHYSEFDTFTIVEPCDQFFENAVAQSKNNDRVNVVRGLLQDKIKEIGSRRYDLILMSSLLHEIPDCESLLRATAQLCDEATIIHLNVPNSKSFHRVLALEMGLIEHLTDRSLTQQQMQQSHTFDLDKLEALANVTGFKAIEMGSFFLKPFTHAQMALLQEVGVATELMLDGLYKLSQYFPEHGSEIYMNIQLGSNSDEK
jgi:2-polyprenyl-3-methyl-5-hydroxy-6-metoxy-1,4-benzoquinol methylase